MQVGLRLRHTSRKIETDLTVTWASADSLCLLFLVLQNNQPLLCVGWIRSILFWALEYGRVWIFLYPAPCPPGTVGYSTNEPGCNHRQKPHTISMKLTPSLFLSPKLFEVDFHTVRCFSWIVPQPGMSRCGWGRFFLKPSPRYPSFPKFTLDKIFDGVSTSHSFDLIFLGSHILIGSVVIFEVSDDSYGATRCKMAPDFIRDRVF